MIMKKQTVLSRIGNTFALAYSNKLYFFFSMLSDLIFFAVFLFAFASFQIKIMEHVSVLFQIAENSLGQLQSLTSANIVDLLTEQPDFAYHLASAFRLVAILMVTIYFVWGFFQGTAWMFCMRIIDAKWKKGLRYFGKFFFVSFVWISLFYAFVYTWVKLSVYAKFSAFAVVSQNFVSALFVVSTILLSYFGLISLGLLKTNSLKTVFQKSIFLGIKKWKRTLPMFILIIAAFLCMALIYFFLLMGTQFALFILFSLLIVLPLTTTSRIFAIITVLEKN
jgi:hypothetical protein